MTTHSHIPHNPRHPVCPQLAYPWQSLPAPPLLRGPRATDRSPPPLPMKFAYVHAVRSEQLTTYTATISALQHSFLMTTPCRLPPPRCTDGMYLHGERHHSPQLPVTTSPPAAIHPIHAAAAAHLATPIRTLTRSILFPGRAFWAGLSPNLFPTGRRLWNQRLDSSDTHTHTHTETSATAHTGDTPPCPAERRLPRIRLF